MAKKKEDTDKKLKLYVVRKYILADSADQAIKKDKEAPVDDVWIDEAWKNNNLALPPLPMGFKEE